MIQFTGKMKWSFSASQNTLMLACRFALQITFPHAVTVTCEYIKNDYKTDYNWQAQNPTTKGILPSSLPTPSTNLTA